MNRRFVIVYGNKGLGVHNAGVLFQWAAETHRTEVRQGAFPGVPAPYQAHIEMYPISSVPDLIKDISTGNVAYLAYFGHSWDRYLFIGERAAAGSNLSSEPFATNAPVTDIPKGKFLAAAQIRLFGCRAGYGTASIASQLHSYLGVTVFAYQNSGGSLFTQDPVLGHGRRAVTQADINHTGFKANAHTWLVPINGVPNFRRF